MLASVGLIAAAVTTGRADSLWERRDPRYGFLFQDNRARNIGDVLTVTITEATVANEQDQKALTRTTTSSGQVQVFGGGPVGAGTAGGTGTVTAPGVGFVYPNQSSNMAFNGNAQNTVNRVFTDRMAVTVVDVMPNGNLVVEGYRSRVVQGEERVLRITGVVRPADIGVGNVITSGSVANFRISYLGRGPTTRTTKQGYLGRLGNLLRP
ncbi:flagellar basal body L-ring protein FlgH [Gemmata sp. G18]|uniref:Flagellar basal body L-ring protein FlgH n=1 Tax=Gemmata palustris TaxID=2822762 RepID=A0ABS5BSZ0_9BACT|nr:flagellar basal body L-ring protein FlgH [Gemmata palustris]MBP3956826.1 flagellar basal body L-ring protein FlgH [Gemmata palustris]